jgi:exopolysaccharide biosynthesis WecB/TagA/CpsF family protein
MAAMRTATDPSSAAAPGPGASNGAKSPLHLIGHVNIERLTEAEALDFVHHALEAPESTPPALLRLAFANAHVVNLAATDTAFREALCTMLVLPDGIGVDLGARILHGAPFPANLNGTDFIPLLITSAHSPLRIGLFGAAAGIAERAAATLARMDARHEIVVLGHGFPEAADERRLLERLGNQPVDLLLVARGNPVQELWIANRIDHRHARVAAGVGALFDFLAGEASRAPGWVRRSRLEWLWRLLCEPARLWQRYVLGNPVFLMRIIAQKLRSRRGQGE